MLPAEGTVADRVTLYENQQEIARKRAMLAAAPQYTAAPTVRQVLQGASMPPPPYTPAPYAPPQPSGTLKQRFLEDPTRDYLPFVFQNEFSRPPVYEDSQARQQSYTAPNPFNASLANLVPVNTPAWVRNPLEQASLGNAAMLALSGAGVPNALKWTGEMAAGQMAGGGIGRAVGGETGEQVGGTAGALIGPFAPALARAGVRAAPEAGEALSTYMKKQATFGYPEEQLMSRPIVAAAEEAPKVGETVPDPFDKLIAAAKQAQKTRPQYELAKSKELSRRVGVAAQVKPTEELSAGEAFLERQKYLKGPVVPGGATLVDFTAEDAEAIFLRLFEAEAAGKLKFFESGNLAEAVRNIADKPMTPYEIKLLRKVIGSKADQLIKPLSMPQKIWREMWGVIGIPRTLLSAGEVSATWRQGGVLLFRNPIISAKSFGRQLQAGAPKISLRLLNRSVETMTGEGVAEARLASWQSHPIIQEYGQKLYLAPIGEEATKAAMGLREEAFVSRTIQRVPILGHMVKMSERAYITFLNEMRARSFLNRIQGRIARGWEVSPEEADIMADWINIATGRGKLGGFERAGGELSTALYSPRLWAARLETLPYAGYAAVKSPMMRKEVAKDLVTFVMGNLSLVALAKLSGVADVELDPRSTDFGKIRIGHMRLDPWGGFQQIARTVAQVATGEVKATRTGEVYNADRLVQLGRYMQGKLSPAAGFLVDVMRGETMIGEEMGTSGESLKAQAWNRLVPMWWQDVQDAVDEYGVKGFIGVLPGALGWGTQIYTSAYETLAEAQDAAARKIINPKTGQPYKNFDDLKQIGTPLANEAIAQDEGVIAGQKAVDEYKATRGGEATVSMGDVAKPFIAEQYADDSAVEAGTLDRKTWLAQYRDRQQNLSSQYAGFLKSNPELAAKMGETAAKIADPFNLPSDATPDTVRAAYFKLFGPYKGETGLITADEWAKLSPDIDRFRANLTPAQSASLDANLGAGKSQLVQEYRQDSVKLQPYWDVQDSLWQEFASKNTKLAPFANVPYQDFLKNLGDQYVSEGKSADMADTNGYVKAFNKFADARTTRFILQNPEIDALRNVWGFTSGVHSIPAARIYEARMGVKPRLIKPS